MSQTWQSVYFAHYPVPVERLRPHVPAGLTIDQHDGSAWVSLIPLRMRDVHLRFLPPVPTAANFGELNFRTYVSIPGEEPGVWFFSIDAASWLGSLVARLVFKLPYDNARIEMDTDGNGATRFTSSRKGNDARFACSLQPRGETFRAEPGSLAYFVAERYALYVAKGGGTLALGRIAHPPWELQEAEGEITVDTVSTSAGIDLTDSTPRFFYSEGTVAHAWLERSVGR